MTTKTISHIDLALTALTDAAQFIDSVKQDAIAEGWWTDWDSEMRGEISTALRALYEAKGVKI